MKTIRTKVYQFSELSTQAKKVAIEQERNDFYEHGDPLYWFEEECQERASEECFNGCKFQWSLSSCQGDGLSFSCDDFNLKKFLIENTRLHKESHINIILNHCIVEIKGNTGHYTYASSSDVDLYLEAGKDYPNIESLVDLVKEELQDKYLALCKDLERQGYKIIETENEDEAIIDRIEANEYDFTKDGKRFNQ